MNNGHTGSQRLRFDSSNVHRVHGDYEYTLYCMMNTSGGCLESPQFVYELIKIVMYILIHSYIAGESTAVHCIAY